MLRLPELVGSPLSINALREDLQVSHKTAAAWLEVLERLYAIFRLPPFGAPAIRAVKKEQKHYHLDWSVVPADPARFENLVACHLLKWVHHRQDTEGRDVELRYFRDTDGREVDFVVLDQRRPVLCIECKWSDDRRGQEPALLQGSLPRLRRMADLCDRNPGLRQCRRHPCRPGVDAAEDVGLTGRLRREIGRVRWREVV